jgi:hypothetical protein
MNRTAEQTKATHKMAQKVANQNQVYVRRMCRKCSNITGGFSTSDLSAKRTCRVIVRGSDNECGGDMEEIYRGKV